MEMNAAEEENELKSRELNKHVPTTWGNVNSYNFSQTTGTTHNFSQATIITYNFGQPEWLLYTNPVRL